MKKLFYGWRISFAGAAMQFMLSSCLVQAFGVYVAVLSEQNGWSKTALAAGAALQSVEGAVLGPVLGLLMERLGPRAMVHMGVVLMSIGFLCFGHIETLPGFYASVLLLVVGGSLCGYFPFSVTLVHWFRQRRARALSLMSLGLALGGISAPAVGWSVQHFGWQHVAFASSGIFLVLGLVLARIVRRNPAEIGETIDGVPLPTEDATIGGTVHAAERSFTVAQALRTRAFWLLGLGHAFALVVVTAVNVHAISHMKEDLHLSLPQAGFVITLMTLSQAFGVLLGAAMGDRWNKRYVAAGCMVAHMAGLLMLAYAVHPLMLGAFAVLHGVAWGLRGPFMQALRADYFGLQSIAMILGLSGILVSIGQVAGPLIAGAFADHTGNYRMGFTLLALVAGSGSVLFLAARKPT